jgi:pSer/pThr/pTyr-binding forkhead associated (FHA) protein
MPHLTILDRTANRSHRVDSADAVVGRDPTAALPMQGEAALVVSGRHARFFLADGAWWVEDIGSRNGTYLGGQRLQVGAPRRLSIGDEVSLGTSGPRLQIQELDARLFAATPPEPMRAMPMQTMMESRPVASLEPAAAPSPGGQDVRLLLRSGEGRRLSGQGSDVIIGRSQDATIRIEGDMSMAVSRRHARIFYSGWKICIEDAGSRNGTWLNRKRVQGPTVLERGDVIEFGVGGPRLTVEDVALVPVEPVRRTQVDMAAPADANSAFVAELPTPAPRPAARASGDKH